MFDLDALRTNMHVGEYVDLGNGVWGKRHAENSYLSLYSEARLLEQTDSILVDSEIVGQRRQRDIPGAPYPYPRMNSAIWRSCAPEQHKIYPHERVELHNVLIADTNVSFISGRSDLVHHGLIVRANRGQNPRRYAIESGVGAVYGEDTDTTWPYDIRTLDSPLAHVAMFQLHSWQWFDPTNPEHDIAHLQTMLKGVSNLTKVRAIALLLGNTVELVKLHSEERFQDWALFFSFNVVRMRKLNTLLSGCFCRWTTNEELIWEREIPGERDYQSSETALWFRIMEALNPGMYRMYQALNTSVPPQEFYRYEIQTGENDIPFIEESIEDYPEAPTHFTENYAMEFDRRLNRLLPVIPV